MDDRRFDALTRSLATGLSRRNVLKSLFGGAVLGGAAATGLDRAAAQTCPEGEFLCNGVCCPTANNCCGETTCCPSSQCNQNSGVCCESFEFACGTGDCCNTAEEKCCDGVCISASLCCPSLPDCPVGQTCCEGVCEDLQNDATNCGACAADCSEGLLCCAGECLACCDSEDCDPCQRCVEGVCEPLLCEDPCEFCDVGVDACVRVCPENELCCFSGPPTDQTITCEPECCDDSDCGACESCVEGICVPGEIPCPLGTVPCCINDALTCVECCTNEDCRFCERCDGSHVCEPLLCDDPCEFCDAGVDECVRACPEDQLCCVVSPPPDLIVECVDGDECCEDDECADCFSCINGSCEPDIILCEPGLVTCCIEGRLECVECCGTEECDPCFVCGPDNICHGGCDQDEICCETPRGFACLDECCPTFGDPCGLVTAAGGSPQLDCCDGLVCCEIDYGAICAECCSDHDCHKGTCCCKDGTCSEHCCDRECEHDKDCGYGACCCHDGTCSERCCDKVCRHDEDCGYGTCCCHDGSCSAKCCKSYTPPVYTLPDTGSGPSSDEGGFTLAAAGALAAYIAARKLRQERSDEGERAVEE